MEAAADDMNDKIVCSIALDEWIDGDRPAVLLRRRFRCVPMLLEPGIRVCPCQDRRFAGAADAGVVLLPPALLVQLDQRMAPTQELPAATGDRVTEKKVVSPLLHLLPLQEAACHRQDPVPVVTALNHLHDSERTERAELHLPCRPVKQLPDILRAPDVGGHRNHIRLATRHRSHHPLFGGHLCSPAASARHRQLDDKGFTST